MNHPAAAIFKQLDSGFFVSPYAHERPLKVYVRVDDSAPEKGYREFTGPGGHFIHEYSYPLYYRDLETELAQFQDACRAVTAVSATPLEYGVHVGPEFLVARDRCAELLR